MNATVTVTVRFRWWVTPLGWALAGPLFVLGCITPHRWHPVIIGKLGVFIARYGVVITKPRVA